MTSKLISRAKFVKLVENEKLKANQFPLVPPTLQCCANPKTKNNNNKRKNNYSNKKPNVE